jgi:hypothetical protein
MKVDRWHAVLGAISRLDAYQQPAAAGRADVATQRIDIHSRDHRRREQRLGYIALVNKCLDWQPHAQPRD